MKKLISLPCMVYNSEEADLLGKEPHECDLIEIERFVNFDRIESISETIPLKNWSESNKIWCTIYMESGVDFIVNMPLGEFIKKYRKLLPDIVNDL